MEFVEEGQKSRKPFQNDSTLKLKLHHVEICVADETSILSLLKNLEFSEICNRQTKKCNQWVFQSGESIFLVTKRKYCNISENDNANDATAYPSLTCCTELTKHFRDAVFNIALEVTRLDEILEKLNSEGDIILQDPKIVTDDYGYILVAVVASKCDGVIHSLIDKQHYRGKFLPGFVPVSKDSNGIILYTSSNYKNLVNHSQTQWMDHVTYVCREGESGNIIRWYERNFGMKRFFTNKDENEDGFVLGGSIGLRLKALQYWRCAEIGIASLNNLKNDHRVFRIVIAEPLPELERSHVKSFLKENFGPGVQHIGLHSDDILRSVKLFQSRNIKFRKPPPTYYGKHGKLKDIEDVGLHDQINELCECGILLDAEADPFIPQNGDKKRYLMQVFTQQIFDRDTFFLEIIQRCGAMGFGAGNIEALALSIIRFKEENEKKKKFNQIHITEQR